MKYLNFGLNQTVIANNIKLEFKFKVKKINPKSRLFNKELGGGAILDLGCYPKT